MSEPGASETEQVVRSTLAEAHIPAAPDEVALFVMMYPILRTKADRMYELDLGDQP
jgi:hypothetical protein